MRSLVGNNLFGVLDDVFNLPIRVEKQALTGAIRVDVVEQSDKYTLTADLPGVAKENVKVKFEQGNLTIAVSAEQKIEQKEGEKVLRSERFSSLRSRTFYFGDNIDDANIVASYKDGVLSLEIPKHQPTVEVREISVQ